MSRCIEDITLDKLRNAKGALSRLNTFFTLYEESLVLLFGEENVSDILIETKQLYLKCDNLSEDVRDLIVHS